MVNSNIQVLQRIIRDSAVCKYAHFKAADRSKKLLRWFGVPAVVINVALGSIFFYSLRQDIPYAAKWIGATLALLAAILGALQTHFNFSRSFEAHRAIANQYNALLRQSEHLEAAFCDKLLKLPEASKRIQGFLETYSTINKSAEPFSPNKRDYEQALRKVQEREKRNAITKK